MWNKFESEPYYGDARRALYPQFLLDARPDLFREIACMDRHTFYELVSTFRTNDLLEDGQSVLGEKQVLIFLDVVCHHNAMRQTALKFRRGLCTVRRYLSSVLNALYSSLTLPLVISPLLSVTTQTSNHP